MYDFEQPNREGGRPKTSIGQADVCIIGAGASGVTVAKALKQQGLVFDCFEMGSDIGGMWRYENDNGRSSAYDSLHIDTSRPNLGYPDLPIGSEYPDFLSHRQFLAYLEAYADHFDIRSRVSFETVVESVVKTEDGRWRVRLSCGDEHEYATVIVANGHLWDPRYPDFPGEFDGDEIHSHYYRTAAPYEDRRVLVVGLGNSAVDIAVDLSRRAEQVTISTRRSAWIMPKYLMGRPIDQWLGFFSKRLRLPTRISRMIMARLIRLGVGDQRRFGVPRPAHPMWREHATLSQELLPYIGHGRIAVKPNVERLDGDEVVFNNGSREAFDAIVYATGYRTRFPFLDNNLFDAEHDVAHLYRRMVSPKHPGLLFAGLVQPVGPTIPLVEIQGRWIAQMLAGKLELPERDMQLREIERHRAWQRRTYVDSKRYTLEVDFKRYATRLKRDMAEAEAGV